MGSFVATSKQKEHVTVSTNTTDIIIKQPSKQPHQNVLSIQRNALLFMNAFTKQFSDRLFLPISIDIINLIMLYSKYEMNVYGIGENHGQFSSKNTDDMDEFTELKEFEEMFKLCSKCNIDHIYHYDRCVTILHEDKQRVYLSGRSNRGSFVTRTEFEELLNSNECIRFLSQQTQQNSLFWVTDKPQRIFTCNASNTAHLHSQISLTTFFKELKIVKIVNNAFTAFFLCENGKVYYWGDTGRLIAVPEIVPNLESEIITNIVSGYNFTLFLNINGNVFGIGEDRFLGIKWNEIDRKSKMTTKVPYSGRIGYGTLKYVLRATKNDKFEMDGNYITQIECGYLHSICLSENGRCYVFGDNSCGQLGIGETECEDVSGQTYELKLDVKIKSIFCGNKHSLILSEKNELFSFGCNDHNECHPQINKHIIYTPKLINKQTIGINEITKIIHVFAGLCWTILVVST